MTDGEMLAYLQNKVDKKEPLQDNEFDIYKQLSPDKPKILSTINEMGTATGISNEPSLPERAVSTVEHYAGIATKPIAEAINLPKNMLQLLAKTITGKPSETINAIPELPLPKDVPTTNLAGQKNMAEGLTQAGAEIAGNVLGGEIIGQGVKGVGKLIGYVNPFKKTLRAFNDIRDTKDLAVKYRGGLEKATDKLYDDFTTSIDDVAAKNPKVLADTTKLLDEIRQDPDLIARANKSKVLKRLLREAADTDLTVKELQSIQNSLKWNPTDSNMKYLKLLIRETIVDNFPTMEQVYKPFKDGITSLKVLRPTARVGGTINKLKQGIGDAEVKAIVEQYFSPELITRVGGYSKLWNFLQKIPFSGERIGKMFERGLRTPKPNTAVSTAMGVAPYMALQNKKE